MDLVKAADFGTPITFTSEDVDITKSEWIEGLAALLEERYGNGPCELDGVKLDFKLECSTDAYSEKRKIAFDSRVRFDTPDGINSSSYEWISSSFLLDEDSEEGSDTFQQCVNAMCKKHDKTVASIFKAVERYLSF